MRRCVLALMLLGWAAAPAAAATLTVEAAPPAADPPEEAEAVVETPPPDLLPDSRVAFGKGPIVRAWLSTPTDRYAHGALGDTLEASSLVVVTDTKEALRLDLPVEAVFEDLTPRIVDLDGDGLHEAVLVVRSGLETGATPAVLLVRDGRIGMTAPAPLGQPNRWLNPIGVADLDADGRQEVAVVETPHGGGTLRIYRWQDGGLEPVAADSGYSNHALGSTTLALHAITDLTGDDRPDILLPGADRQTLKLVGLDKDGGLTVHQTWDLPAAVEGPLSVTADGGVVVPLADGRQARVVR